MTKLACSMIDNSCVSQLRNSFTYLFDTNNSRDTHFAANLNQLVNDGLRQTIAFVGTSKLDYAYWNGTTNPQTYDSSEWVEIPVASTTTGDTHYWGDPSVDLSMRARRDPANGYLIFERRISGSWVEKFRVSDSITVDALKLIHTTDMPVIQPDELGLHNVLLKDSEAGDAQILRPVFMSHTGDHYMMVAALPNGKLRVPQNVDAAIADPDGTPLTYKYVVFEGDGVAMRDALASLAGSSRLDASAIKNLPSSITVTGVAVRDALSGLSGDERLDASAIKNMPVIAITGVAVRDALGALTGDDRLDASAIKNLPTSTSMTGTEIIHAIENDPSDPKLPAADVSDLTGTEYREYDQATPLDPINKTYMEIVFEHTGAVTQTMPNLVNSRDGLRLMVRNYKTDDSVVTLVPANSGETIDGVSTYDVDPGVSVLFIAMTGRSSWHVETTFEHAQGPVTAGITFDNNTVDVAGVTKCNVPTCEILVKGGGEIDLTPYITFRNEPSDQSDNLSHQLVVQPPLKTFSDPGVDGGGKLFIDPGAYEPLQAPGYLAYIKEDAEVIGKEPDVLKHHKGALWFDDIVVPSGPFIETDMVNKAYGIQEFDGLDPNVTGGTDFLIAFRTSFKGVAPNNGFVRIALIDKSTSAYLTDKNGNLTVIEKHFSAGDKLGVLDLIAVVNATGLKEFKTVAIDNFTDDLLVIEDRTEGASGLMIQALSSTAKTGNALQQFEIDTQQNIEFSSHYLGPGRATIQWIVSKDTPVTEGAAGAGITMADGWGLHNISKLKLGVVSGHLHFEDNGTDIADFNFHKVFSAEETQMLRGKQVKATVTLIDKDSAFNVALMKWTGKPDEYTPAIFESRNNGTPLFQTNWEKVDDLFISEDVVVGDHTVDKTFTVPTDANNYALIIYPVGAQLPLTLKLKEFKIDVVVPFVGYIVHAPELVGEHHLIYDDEYKELIQDTQGYTSLRYTLAGSVLPMPVGELGKGAADISLDTSINTVPGSAARGGEGAIKFNAEGRAIISTQLLLWSEQASGTSSVVKFWYSTVGPGDQLTKIDDSEGTFTVNGDTKGALYTMPTFGIDVEEDDRIALSAQADKADGAYLECVTPSKPMLQTTINFKELIADQGDVPGIGLDLSAFTQLPQLCETAVYEFTSVSTIDIPVIVPAGVTLGVVSVHRKDGDTVRPIKNFDYKYENGHLLFSLGATYTGQIVVEFYA